MMNRFVILGNGEYPSSRIPLEILDKAEYVVCCDGAANEYIRLGNMPAVVVGDGDSLSDDIKERYPHLIYRIADQETNDLTKAVQYLYSKNIKEFSIVGASGKREDHALGNISLLLQYRRMGIKTRMYTEYGYFMACNDTVTIPSYNGQQISIINFNAIGLSSSDLKYPLRDFSEWWQGTLNESLGNTVTIHAQGEYIIFINY